MLNMMAWRDRAFHEGAPRARRLAAMARCVIGKRGDRAMAGAGRRNEKRPAGVTPPTPSCGCRPG